MITTRILAIGKIVANNEIQWDISPLPQDTAQDGELQRIIDEAEDTLAYEDYLLDVEWLRSGC